MCCDDDDDDDFENCCECCEARISLCLIALANLALVVLVAPIFCVMIWAELNWDFTRTMTSLEAKNAKIVFYVCIACMVGTMVTAVVGICACFCNSKQWMLIYSLCVLGCAAVLTALLLSWIAVFMVVLLNLHQKMTTEFLLYQGETSLNQQSVTFNFLWVAFETCGVDGPNDFKLYNVKASSLQGFENFTHPLTCCRHLSDRLDPADIRERKLTFTDWEKMNQDELYYFQQCFYLPNSEGAFPVMKKFVAILYIVVILVLLALLFFLCCLSCGTCSILRRGAKSDEWGRVYNRLAHGDIAITKTAAGYSHHSTNASTQATSHGGSIGRNYTF